MTEEVAPKRPQVIDVTPVAPKPARPSETKPADATKSETTKRASAPFDIVSAEEGLVVEGELVYIHTYKNVSVKGFPPRDLDVLVIADERAPDHERIGLYVNLFTRRVVEEAREYGLDHGRRIYVRISFDRRVPAGYGGKAWTWEGDIQVGLLLAYDAVVPKLADLASAARYDGIRVLVRETGCVYRIDKRPNR